MEIKQILESGILETYVMGIATEEEIDQVLFYKKRFPEVDEALHQLEADLETLAFQQAIEPPAGTLQKIEDQIRELQLREQAVGKRIYTHDGRGSQAPQNPYIDVESSSSHMRIHKAWRWVFAAVFILGKIFLGCAIYYYLSNRQAQEQIQELKMEIKQKGIR